MVLDRHAIGVLARLSEARADLESLVSGSSGTVRVGTFQSTGARILPAVLRQFRERLPGVRVELIERGDEDELLALATAGDLDLTFADRRCDRGAAGVLAHRADARPLRRAGAARAAASTGATTCSSPSSRARS